MIFWGVFTLLASDIEGRGLPWRVSSVSLVSAIATIGLDLLLIPLWNATGAAIVSSITYGLSMFLAAHTYFRIMGISTRKILLPQREDLQFFAEITQHAVLRVRRSITSFTSGQV
jgi:O-antigen/teichoic acid export membrane protein